MHYQFDYDCAVEMGVEKAVLLTHLMFWIQKNKANERNFFDGRYWTYNSANAFCDLFEFWSKAKTARILRSLEEDGWIISGNYNSSKYDRTKWYALSDKCMLQKWALHCSDLQNGKCESEQPIPDSNPDSNPDNKLHISFERVWEMYGRKGNKQDALGNWLKLSEASRVEVEERIPAYVRSVSEKKYLKDFSGWLNPSKKRWLNEIVPQESSTQSHKQLPEDKDYSKGW